MMTMALRQPQIAYEYLQRINAKLTADGGQHLTKKQRHKVAVEVIEITALLVEPQASKRQQDNAILALLHAARALEGNVVVDKHW